MLDNLEGYFDAIGFEMDKIVQYLNCSKENDKERSVEENESHTTRDVQSY